MVTKALRGTAKASGASKATKKLSKKEKAALELSRRAKNGDQDALNALIDIAQKQEGAGGSKRIVEELGTIDRLIQTGFLKKENANRAGEVSKAFGRYENAFEGNAQFRQNEMDAYDRGRKTDIQYEQLDVTQSRPEDLLGKVGIGIASDKSPIATVREADGMLFDDPVDQQGGYGHAVKHGGWSSKKSISEGRQRAADFVSEETGGKDVVGVINTMGEGSQRFATPSSEMIMKQMLISKKIPKEDIDAFDAKMRQFYPKWVGLWDDRAIAQLQGSATDAPKLPGKAKTKFSEIASEAYFRDRGFPNWAIIDRATTAPDLRDTPVGSAGVGFFEMEPGKPTTPSAQGSGHRSYDTDFQYGSKFLGQWPLVDVPMDVVFWKAFKEQKKRWTKPKKSAARPFTDAEARNAINTLESLQEQPNQFWEVFDEEWLENINKFINSKAVKKAAFIAGVTPAVYALTAAGVPEQAQASIFTAAWKNTPKAFQKVDMDSGTPVQWKKKLKKYGQLPDSVSEFELNLLPWDELDQNTPLTKDQVMAFVEENRPQLEVFDTLKPKTDIAKRDKYAATQAMSKLSLNELVKSMSKAMQPTHRKDAEDFIRNRYHKDWGKDRPGTDELKKADEEYTKAMPKARKNYIKGLGKNALKQKDMIEAFDEHGMLDLVQDTAKDLKETFKKHPRGKVFGEYTDQEKDWLRLTAEEELQINSDIEVDQYSVEMYVDEWLGSDMDDYGSVFWKRWTESSDTPDGRHRDRLRAISEDPYGYARHLSMNHPGKHIMDPVTKEIKKVAETRGDAKTYGILFLEDLIQSMAERKPNWLEEKPLYNDLKYGVNTVDYIDRGISKDTRTKIAEAITRQYPGFAYNIEVMGELLNSSKTSATKNLRFEDLFDNYMTAEDFIDDNLRLTPKEKSILYSLINDWDDGFWRGTAEWKLDGDMSPAEEIHMTFMAGLDEGIGYVDEQGNEIDVTAAEMAALRDKIPEVSMKWSPEELGEILGDSIIRLANDYAPQSLADIDKALEAGAAVRPRRGAGIVDEDLELKKQLEELDFGDDTDVARSARRSDFSYQIAGDFGEDIREGLARYLEDAGIDTSDYPYDVLDDLLYNNVDYAVQSGDLNISRGLFNDVRNVNHGDVDDDMIIALNRELQFVENYIADNFDRINNKFVDHTKRHIENAPKKPKVKERALEDTRAADWRPVPPTPRDTAAYRIYNDFLIPDISRDASDFFSSHFEGSILNWIEDSFYDSDDMAADAIQAWAGDQDGVFEVLDEMGMGVGEDYFPEEVLGFLNELQEAADNNKDAINRLADTTFADTDLDAEILGIDGYVQIDAELLDNFADNINDWYPGEGHLSDKLIDLAESWRSDPEYLLDEYNPDEIDQILDEIIESVTDNAVEINRLANRRFRWVGEGEAPQKTRREIETDGAVDRIIQRVAPDPQGDWWDMPINNADDAIEFLQKMPVDLQDIFLDTMADIDRPNFFAEYSTPQSQQEFGNWLIAEKPELGGDELSPLLDKKVEAILAEEEANAAAIKADDERLFQNFSDQMTALWGESFPVPQSYDDIMNYKITDLAQDDSWARIIMPSEAAEKGMGTGRSLDEGLRQFILRNVEPFVVNAKNRKAIEEGRTLEATRMATAPPGPARGDWYDPNVVLPDARGSKNIPGHRQIYFNLKGEKGTHGHMKGQPGNLFWIRTTPRTGPNGEKLMMIEEIQSDVMKNPENISEYAKKLREKMPKKWQEKALHGAIKMAQDEGYDGVVFARTPSQVSKIEGWGYSTDDIDRFSRNHAHVARQYIEEFPKHVKKILKEDPETIVVDGFELNYVPLKNKDTGEKRSVPEAKFWSIVPLAATVGLGAMMPAEKTQAMPMARRGIANAAEAAKKLKSMTKEDIINEYYNGDRYSVNEIDQVDIYKKAHPNWRKTDILDLGGQILYKHNDGLYRNVPFEQFIDEANDFEFTEGEFRKRAEEEYGQTLEESAFGAEQNETATDYISRTAQEQELSQKQRDSLRKKTLSFESLSEEELLHLDDLYKQHQQLRSIPPEQYTEDMLYQIQDLQDEIMEIERKAQSSLKPRLVESPDEEGYIAPEMLPGLGAMGATAMAAQTDEDIFMEELQKLVDLYYTGDYTNEITTAQDYIDAFNRGEIDSGQYRYLVDAAEEAARKRMVSPSLLPSEQQELEEYDAEKPEEKSVYAPKRSMKTRFEERIERPGEGGFIRNEDGSISTHRMAAEVDENGDWYAFPTVVEMPDGSLHQFDNNYDAFDYNKLTGNVKSFGKDKESALKYAEGGYKTQEFLDWRPPEETQEEADSGFAEDEEVKRYDDPYQQAASQDQRTEVAKQNIDHLAKQIIGAGEVATTILSTMASEVTKGYGGLTIGSLHLLADALENNGSSDLAEMIRPSETAAEFVERTDMTGTYLPEGTEGDYATQMLEDVGGTIENLAGFASWIPIAYPKYDEEKGLYLHEGQGGDVVEGWNKLWNYSNESLAPIFGKEFAAGVSSLGWAAPSGL